MSDLVTIIVPAYNAGPLLVEALRSALAQTHENLELLVIDDGSTDGSVDDAARDERVAADGRVRFVRQDNAGKSVAMNRALDLARGDFAMLLDADDVCHPRRAERLVAEMRAFPEVAGVMSGFELVIGGRHLAPIAVAKDEQRCARDIDRFQMPSHDPTLMVRLSAVGDVRYEPDLRVGQGYDYILRIGERHPMRVVTDVLYGYRVVAGSATRGDAARRERFVREVKRRAATRRGLDADRLFPESVPPAGASSNSLRDNGITNHFKASAKSRTARGERLQALYDGLFCASMHPLDPAYWGAILLAMLPSGYAEARHERRAARAAAALAHA